MGKGSALSNMICCQPNVKFRKYIKVDEANPMFVEGILPGGRE